MTDNDFQLQLRLRLIKTLKKQTTTNNDHDNDLIIPDSATWWVQLDQIFCCDLTSLLFLDRDHFSLFIIKVSDLRIDEIKHF